MPLAIVLSGTPGTGKTVVGNLIAQRLNWKVLDLSQIIEKYNLVSSRDTVRNTLIADTEAVRQYLIKAINEAEDHLIIIGHFADETPDQFVKYLILLRTHPVTLAQRLRERDWPQPKILENIQAEILGECTAQALQRHPAKKLFEIDTTHLTPIEVANIVDRILQGQGTAYSVGRISWLHTLDPLLIHKIMEEEDLPK